VSLRAGVDTELGGKVLCLCCGSNPSCQSSSLWSDIIVTQLPQLLHMHIGVVKRVFSSFISEFQIQVAHHDELTGQHQRNREYLCW
jgi:hypothetical protein